MIISVLLLGLFIHDINAVTYEPTWQSLDQRPLPTWYDQSKLGIFIHWGVYSVPSFGGEWFWWFWQGSPMEAVTEFMQKNYRPSWTYPDFAADLTAEFFEPAKWADLLKASGAKYVVLTSKHHEGYTMWPSKRSFGWNSMDVGPKRDIVGELANAIRTRTDLHFGLYYSLFEWFNRLYLQDKNNGFITQDFIKEKIMPELHDIVNSYRPELLWADGEWEANSSYWDTKHFLAWLYNESPVKDTVVVNDRWGAEVPCTHGGYYTCHDRYEPGTLQTRKWENCMTIDKSSWGYRRDADLANFYDIRDLLGHLVKTVSLGGNLLLNVGATKEGTIIPVFEERLRQMGHWLQVNGKAIYETVPWIHQNDSVAKNVWYTSKVTASGTKVYAILLEWPGSVLTLGSVHPLNTATVKLLGYNDALINWSRTQSYTMEIMVPVIPINRIPCEWAWVFELENVTQL